MELMVPPPKYQRFAVCRFTFEQTQMAAATKRTTEIMIRSRLPELIPTYKRSPHTPTTIAASRTTRPILIGIGTFLDPVASIIPSRINSKTISMISSSIGTLLPKESCEEALQYHFSNHSASLSGRLRS